MKKNKKAESLVAIVIGVFILSIVIIAMSSILGSSKELEDTFGKKSQVNLLLYNSRNIISKLDLSSLNNGDIFYLYKNDSSKNFEIKTDSSFAYVDKYGNKINDINNFGGNIFERSFKLDIIDMGDYNYYNVTSFIKLLAK